MYILKRFLGDEFDKFNTIIDSYNYDQNSCINLAACVSYPFQEVMDIQAMPLSTLPTEGTIGNRYFPICYSLDEIEKYAEELALDLFKINKENYRVSVQPNSGTQANQIVYNALLNDGDIVLSLSPKDGGHISHTKMGCRNISVIHLNLDNNLDVDYLMLENLLQKYHPKLIIIGASSYPKEFDYQRIYEISSPYGSKLMADICHSVLYIAGNVHKDIFPYVDFVTFTMDKTLRGPQGGIIIYRSEYDKSISQSIFPKTQGGPIQNIMFAKAMCFLKLHSTDVHTYATQIIANANLLIHTLKQNNVKTVTSFTSNHIILIDLTESKRTGIEIEKKLFDNKIIANRNQIPNDPQNAFITSGVRLGTTVITNLEYSPQDIILLGNYISQIITSNTIDSKILNTLINKYHVGVNISN
jgi:glycine hydroxymethyltransferase